MNIFIPLGLFLFLISNFAKNSYKRAQNAFLFCFLVMLVFAAIRYEFGPDYVHYRDAFSFLKGSDIDTFQEEYHDHMEIWFVRFFNLFNSYFIYIMVMSLIWHGVMYWFFKKYVLYQYYYVVILLMFFNVNLCLMNYIAFRSSLASCFFFIGFICLAFGSQDIFILKKWRFISNIKKSNIFLYLIFVFIGSMFHTSLLIFLIIPFITSDRNYSKRLSNTFLTVFFIIAILMPFVGTGFTKSIAIWIMNLFSDSFARYEGYLGEGTAASGGIGALVFNLSKVAVAYPILYALTIEKDSHYRRVMQFAIVFIFMLLVVESNLLSRYMMCFYPVIIVALLRSYSYALPLYRQVSLLSILLLSVSQLYAVINSPYSVSFLQYHTIFSAPNWQ